MGGRFNNVTFFGGLIYDFDLIVNYDKLIRDKRRLQIARYYFTCELRLKYLYLYLYLLLEYLHVVLCCLFSDAQSD